MIGRGQDRTHSLAIGAILAKRRKRADRRVRRPVQAEKAILASCSVWRVLVDNLHCGNPPINGHLRAWPGRCKLPFVHLRLQINKWELEEASAGCTFSASWELTVPSARTRKKSQPIAVERRTCVRPRRISALWRNQVRICWPAVALHLAGSDHHARHAFRRPF